MVNRSFTEHLQSEPEASFDGYVLLDAQDWMTDGQLNALWARDHAHRRARRPRHLPHRRRADRCCPAAVDEAILGRWRYEEEQSRRFDAADRSSTYGGFHLYVLDG